MGYPESGGVCLQRNIICRSHHHCIPNRRCERAACWGPSRRTAVSTAPPVGRSGQRGPQLAGSRPASRYGRWQSIGSRPATNQSRVGQQCRMQPIVSNTDRRSRPMCSTKVLRFFFLSFASPLISTVPFSPLLRHHSALRVLHQLDGTSAVCPLLALGASRVCGVTDPPPNHHPTTTSADHPSHTQHTHPFAPTLLLELTGGAVPFPISNRLISSS